MERCSCPALFSAPRLQLPKPDCSKKGLGNRDSICQSAGQVRMYFTIDSKESHPVASIIDTLEVIIFCSRLTDPPTLVLENVLIPSTIKDRLRRRPLLASCGRFIA